MGLGDVASDCTGHMVGAIRDYDYAVEHKGAIVSAMTHLIRLQRIADGHEGEAILLSTCRKEALKEWRRGLALRKDEFQL